MFQLSQSSEYSNNPEPRIQNWVCIRTAIAVTVSLKNNLQRQIMMKENMIKKMLETEERISQTTKVCTNINIVQSLPLYVSFL